MRLRRGRERKRERPFVENNKGKEPKRKRRVQTNNRKKKNNGAVGYSFFSIQQLHIFQPIMRPRLVV
ncbi:hypothetical protein VNO77_01365 [Canavalia gladiata]|uniref:Uncharacterized protein n=1 Tax=Canavalia gladiata TaxID=3824 RepID=A0AAN9R568_CANGL